MVEAAPMADGQAKDRMRFLTRQMVDAMAPSNFLATNPEFVKTAMETKGLSIQKGIQNLIRALNRLYASEPAMHAMDCKPDGFRWIDGSNSEHSVLCYLRQSKADGSDALLIVFNFTPEVRHDYRVGVPNAGTWKPILNTDDKSFGGSGVSGTGGTGGSFFRVNVAEVKVLGLSGP